MKGQAIGTEKVEDERGRVRRGLDLGSGSSTTSSISDPGQATSSLLSVKWSQ